MSDAELRDGQSKPEVTENKQSQPSGQDENVEVHNLKVGEHDTKFVIKDDNIQVEQPKGLEGEALDKWKVDAEKAISAMAFANKKNYESNRAMDELKRRQDELEQREKWLKEREEMLKNIKEVDSKSTTKSGEEDLAKLLQENPAEFANRIREQVKKEVVGTAVSEAQSQLLYHQITAEGYDPKEVENFAKGYLGANLNRNVYETFKKLNKPPQKGILPDLQTNKITFVPTIDSQDTDQSNPYKQILKTRGTDANDPTKL